LRRAARDRDCQAAPATLYTRRSLVERTLPFLWKFQPGAALALVVFAPLAPRRTTMPRKPGLNSEFVMFDVIYEDGSQRSNRKVPRALLGGLDGDKAAYGFLIEQDREIAEKSGRPPLKIRTIARSGEKKKTKDYAVERYN
jgi:hypothetical protein